MNRNVLFSSATDEWATPQGFFDELNSVFHFDLDAAATAQNHKCETFYTREQDGQRFAGGVDWWHCSRCSRLVTDVERNRFDYCPWCGARMDGDSDG